MKKNDAFYITVLLVSAVCFFIPFLGSVHLFDWDEINFAESAREMIVSGDYSRVQINFHPFWEKPPLFFWLQAGCMHLFGINEFAARLPDAITGIISLITFYFIGKKIIDQKFGFIWAVSYLGSFLPHLYFKSGIIDPVFNYFIFLGIYFQYRSITGAHKKSTNALLSGIFIGFANLTKGPVGLLIFFLTFLTYWLYMRFKKIFTIKNSFAFIFSFSAVSFLWFGWEIIHNGTWFVYEFIRYQARLFSEPVAGHQGPVYYHFVIVFLGCFPISVFALPLLFKRKHDEINRFTMLMRILFWVILILFSIVATKIVHYSSLSYFPLSFLAALYIYRMICQKSTLANYVFVLLLTAGFLFSFLLTAVPLIAAHKELIIPYIKDPFAVACLQLPVKWSGFEFMAGILYFLMIVASAVIMKRGSIQKGALLLFYSTALCMFFYLVAVVPKIESYSQGSAVNFYKSLSGKNVYVTTFGFKSYAQYFYFNKPAPTKYNENEDDSLIHATLDRPAYFVTKITNTDLPDICSDCRPVGKEGGFLFYRRN